MQKKKHNHNNKKIMLIIIVMCVLTAGAIIYADIQLRPSVITIAKYKIDGLVTRAVNNAVIKQFETTQMDYEDMVDIQKNDKGEISSINYNSIQINKLKSQLVDAILIETQKIPDSEIFVPIGNITNFDFLQNKGPNLKFKISPNASVQADVESVFKNTGINQINHQIFIIINVSATALIPNYSTSILVVNKVCVAETIIIGKVPEYFLSQGR